MMQKYISLSDLDIRELGEVLHYFPLLYKMSKGKQIKQGFERFSSPINMTDIKVMIESDRFANCALVLYVFCSIMVLMKTISILNISRNRSKESY